MNSDQWQKAKDLFEAALRCPSDKRRRFIDENCDGDAEVRREVKSLLATSDDAASFLEQPAVGEVAETIAGQKSPVGKTLGHYKILSQIGAGGMGEVYLAEDLRLHRRVALKILSENIAADKDYLPRFEQEALAASALNHPNILTIYEIVESNGSRFIASEYVKGETLRRTIQNLSLTETLDIAVQMAAALDAAHRSGIIHRDIKPENIMRREDGLIKVLDFGLAKLMEKQTENPDTEAATRALVQTKSGLIMGTAAYMSPKQARGRAVDARSDIFSFGVVLYEMLTGKTPFAGDSSSDVIAAILKTEPAPLARYDVPKDLERIVSRALRKNADERYQHIKDLLIDLKDFKQDSEFEAKLERSVAPSKTVNATADKSAAFTEIQNVRATSGAEYIANEIKNHKLGFGILSVFLLASIGLGYWFFANRSATATPIESIAVMPFVNESGNADVEYLSDGMTETLIGSLSQLPKLNVKARSSVFRYKGKDTNANTIGRELNVQAILNGRVVQRGQDLILYVELVDAATENSLWKQTYNKTMTNLVALQNDIARDVADKLKVKLSGADEQRLAKNYMANAEAYQLYLKGRYHVLKFTPAEVQKGISYFQQAIKIDPNYALAYTGLSDAYRSFAQTGDMPSTEFMPKAKAAANKAIEIDDTLAEAHIALGVAIFWYDWDWSAAGNQYKRALELNPNSAEAHFYYAHLLSNTGQHAEALAEVKLARELEPLSLRINTLEGQFLIYAGRSDEALARLQKTFELEPNYWFAYQQVASAYIEKGMFAEAIVAARKGRESYDASSRLISFIGYALAKLGRRAEAQAELEGLLKLSTERYIPPYNIAMIYNGLGDTDKTLAWLEKGYQQRDTRMTFLKVEPKWNNLRDDSRFQDLLRRVGFPQ